MPYVNLLNHIMVTHNLTRSELAHLLKIKYSDFILVLNNEKELKKKQLQLLSLLTQIPVELIKTGDFILTKPTNNQKETIDNSLGSENLQRPQNNEVFETEQRLHIEATEKNRNLTLFKAFAKKRCGSDLSCLSFFKVVLVIEYIIAFVIIVSEVCSNQFSPINTNLIISLLPLTLAFISTLKTHKVVTRFSFRELDKLKIYFKTFFISFLICDFIAIFTTTYNILTFILNLIPCIYVAYDLLNPDRCITTHKAHIKREISLIICFSLMTLSFLLFGYYEGETFNNFFYFISRGGTLSSIVIMYQNYCALHLCKSCKSCFGKIPEETYIKKNSFKKSVISVIIVIGISLALVHAHFIALYYSVSSNYTYLEKEEYTKTNVTYGENEKTQKLNFEKFSVEIPEGMTTKKETEQSISYDDGVTMIIITRTSLYPDSEEVNPYSFSSNPFDDDNENYINAMTEIEEYIEKKYGFYPQNEFEYYKLEKLLNETKPNMLNKKDLAARILYSMIYAIGSPIYDSCELYQNGTMYGIMYSMERTDKETQENSKSYIFQFDSGDFTFLGYNIMLRTTDLDSDTIYKIINSIQIKE